MNLFRALDKSLLLILGQKGLENTITSKSKQQVTLQISDLAEIWTWQKTDNG